MSARNDELLIDRDGPVVRLTLNRPDRLNAITSDMWDGLDACFREVDANRDDRVLVITGAGDSFCSGIDFANPGLPREVGGRIDYVRRLSAAALSLHNLRTPTIAAVRGRAFGAGLNLALGCDLVVADTSATFSEIFVTRALSPDFGGTWLLPRLIGLHRAKELALLGDVVAADRAEAIGLVNRVVDPDDLDSTVAEIAGRLATLPPIALAHTKALLNGAFESSMAEGLEAETRAQVLNTMSNDSVEAARAFRDRRPPEYTGD